MKETRRFFLTHCHNQSTPRAHSDTRTRGGEGGGGGGEIQFRRLIKHVTTATSGVKHPSISVWAHFSYEGARSMEHGFT